MRRPFDPFRFLLITVAGRWSERCGGAPHCGVASDLSQPCQEEKIGNVQLIGTFQFGAAGGGTFFSKTFGPFR
jgi:hypothetical protein